MISKFKFHFSNRTLLYTGLIGAFILFLGVCVGFKILPDLITDKIWKMKVLKPNTQQWDLFMKVPFPFTFKVYIFDVQNPDEILQGGKPRVKEAGPYVYKVYKWKSEVEWNSTDIISYYGYMRFEFDKQASGIHTEEDTVTILNTPYLTMLLTVEATQPNALPMIEGVLPGVFGENDGLFVKVKVKDYLFDGLKMCENGGKQGGFATGIVCKQVTAKLKEAKNMRLVNNTILFSNLHYKNNSHQGRFTINSGIQNREEAGVLKLFNGQPYISSWVDTNSLCNKIRGVTTIFPANIQKNMVFESFAEDVCRAMSLEYKQEEILKGVLGYRFEAMNDSFSSTKEDNYCFCTNNTRTLEGNVGCLKDGLIDLTTCTGAPVLMSFPHMLYADHEYLSSVIGLKPNVDEHGTFVILEPISGFPLKMAQRIQFNMFLRPIEGISSLENVSNAVFPIIWVEESTTLMDKFIDQLKNTLFRNLYIINIARWTFVVMGSAAIIMSFFLFVYIKAP